MNPDSSEIKKFLSKVRQVIDKVGGFNFHEREKNMKALNKHGLTIDIAKFYIKNLEVKDYYKGPCEDDKDDCDDIWWIFEKKIKNTVFYIKIGIKENRVVVCISFHD